VARALRHAGADVVLVSGPVNITAPPGVRCVSVETAEQMQRVVQDEVAGAAIFVGTAAVADYRPLSAAAHKIKKTSDTLQLDLTRTPDILATVAARADRPFVVGFAAETNNVEQHAREKLLRKNLDLIAANEVGECKAFDCDEELPCCSKQSLAEALVALIVRQFAQRDSVRQRA
jgi:phosphopantothenoylcysteine decarboxylase/phosphopantothenate--cysteine ligase